MYQGKINAALKLLEERSKENGVLRCEEKLNLDGMGEKSVLEILQRKHPKPQELRMEALPFRNEEPPDVHPVSFEAITASIVRRAALQTKGAAGPSGLDAYCWRRLCTAFQTASDDLCQSLSMLARKLCTSYVDHRGIAPLLACRLVASDKSSGVRPIGIGNTVRRIIAKVILLVTKAEIQEIAGQSSYV